MLLSKNVTQIPVYGIGVGVGVGVLVGVAVGVGVGAITEQVVDTVKSP